MLVLETAYSASVCALQNKTNTRCHSVKDNVPNLAS